MDDNSRLRRFLGDHVSMPAHARFMASADDARGDRRALHVRCRGEHGDDREVWGAILTPNNDSYFVVVIAPGVVDSSKRRSYNNSAATVRIHYDDVLYAKVGESDWSRRTTRPERSDYT